MPRYRRTVLSLAILVLGCTSARAAESCLSDTSARERVTGTLSIERVKDGLGRLEWHFLLTLEAPVCLATEDPIDRVEGTRSIHIFATDPAISARISRHVGSSIAVRGRPFPAHTSQHHAPIVMEVAEIGGK